MERASRARSDHHPGLHGRLVCEGAARELRGEELNVGPARELGQGHTHGRDRSVVADARVPLAGQLLDVCVEGFFRRAVRILVRPEVDLTIPGLRVLLGPRLHLGLVDHHGVGVEIDPRLEPLEHFVVGVLAHPRVDAVVPSVKATDEVRTVDEPIGQQGASMQAAPVEHRDLVVGADHHQVDTTDQSVGRGAVGKGAPRRDLEGAGRSRGRWKI